MVTNATTERERTRPVPLFIQGVLTGLTLALTAAGVTFLVAVPAEQVADSPFSWLVSAAVACGCATWAAFTPAPRPRTAR